MSIGGGSLVRSPSDVSGKVSNFSFASSSDDEEVCTFWPFSLHLANCAGDRNCTLVAILAKTNVKLLAKIIYLSLTLEIFNNSA